MQKNMLNKKYHNLRLIVDKLSISSLDYTVSEDLKVLLQMVRKLQHQSTLVRIA